MCAGAGADALDLCPDKAKARPNPGPAARAGFNRVRRSGIDLESGSRRLPAPEGAAKAAPAAAAEAGAEEDPEALVAEFREERQPDRRFDRAPDPLAKAEAAKTRCVPH